MCRCCGCIGDTADLSFLELRIQWFAGVWGTQMDANRPESVSTQLEALLRKGDLEGLLSLYENKAVFADFDGAALGLAEIRSAHQKFLNSGLVLTLNDSIVFEVGDIALVHWSWTVDHDDGTSTEGISAEALRRQADGNWKFTIDNSRGSALVGFL
jgi:ketosteroid isomerase-like protein